MNIYQRLVLVCGAIALVVAIWTAPKVKIEDVYVTHFLPSITDQARGNEPPAPPPSGYEVKKVPPSGYEIKKISPSEVEQPKPPDHEIREILPSELAKPMPKEYKPLNAPLTDLRAVLARVIGVVGSTLFVFSALKGVKSK